jgi:hypothetical protein
LQQAVRRGRRDAQRRDHVAVLHLTTPIDEPAHQVGRLGHERF